MKLTEREHEGLTVWTFLYGTDGVLYDALHSAGLTRYFIFADFVEKGLLSKSHNPETYESKFKITDLTLSLVKGEHNEHRT